MPAWSVEYDGFDSAQERLRETLCTVGNGYFATRGSAPEAVADAVHYPGTYAAGCYNALTDTVAGREVVNESTVNLPDWLATRLRFDDGPWFDAAAAELTHVHLAALAGSLDVLQRCFAGVETRGDTLHLNPFWPQELGRLEFTMGYREHALTVEISGQRVLVSAGQGGHAPIRVRCRGETAVLSPGGQVTFPGPAGKAEAPG